MNRGDERDLGRRDALGIGVAPATLAVWLFAMPLAIALFAVILQFIPSGIGPALWKTFLSELPFWFAWALFTPAVFAASARWRLERGRWKLSLVVHVVLSMLVSIAVLFVALIPGAVLGVENELTFGAGPRTMIGMMVVYFGIVGVQHALAYRSAYHYERERKLRTDAELARAQLQAIQSQLQPHFLFNTLNTISSLITREPKTARLMLVHLSDLLRTALQRARLREVSLADEVRFAQSYLEIQRLRFGDRLTISIDVEPEAGDTSVPPMLLQPILENAFRHGLPEDGVARVELHAGRTSEGVRIEVRDNGPGFGTGSTTYGTGLGSVVSLLDGLHRGRYRLALMDRAGGGGAVVIDLPDG